MYFKYKCDNFEEAMDIHAWMFGKLREQGFVTCRDLAKITGTYDSGFTDSKYDHYGWVNLQTLKVELDPNDNIWCIITPEIIEIKNIKNRKGED